MLAGGHLLTLRLQVVNEQTQRYLRWSDVFESDCLNRVATVSPYCLQVHKQCGWWWPPWLNPWFTRISTSFPVSDFPFSTAIVYLHKYSSLWLFL